MLGNKWVVSQPGGNEVANRRGLKSIFIVALIVLGSTALIIQMAQGHYLAALQSFGTLLADQLTGLLIVISLVVFVSGAIKGIAGIGMGLVAVPAMSIIYDPVLAVCVIAVPLVITNFWQGVVRGDAGEVLKKYRPLFVTMTIAMLCSGYFAMYFSVSVTSLTLGLMAIVFATMNLGLTLPKVSQSYDIPLQIVCGALAGFVGGITGLVVIPLVFYMICLRVGKNEFVSAMGLLLLLSGVILIFCYGLNGAMTVDLLFLSTLVSVPALVGVVAGESIRPYLNDQLFRKIVLYIIMAIGAKILFDVAGPDDLAADFSVSSFTEY